MSYERKSVTKGRTERFLSKILPPDERGCTLWSGCVHPESGYGQFRGASGQTEHAHRSSWKIHHGEIPDGLFVCHKCDVRACVNPDHLFLGTTQDNTRDMIAKGRSVRGERQWCHKLTEKMVLDIVRLFGAGYLQRELAPMFGVKLPCISFIVTGRKWSYLTGIKFVPQKPRTKKSP